MLPAIKKPKRQQRRDKNVDDLFSGYEEQIPKCKDEFNYEIMQNLEPIHVEGIYHQKKQQKSNPFDTYNSPSNRSKYHMRNSSMKNLHKSKEFDTPSLSNIFTPRGKNLLQFSNLRRTPENTDNSPRTPNKGEKKGSESQRGFPKSKSHHVIPVDQIEQANYFEEMYQQKQQELEDDQNDANSNLPNFIQKEYTKRWGEVNVSLKKSDRHLQQEVSQTMKTINNNLKQIVQEQENKRIIRNLTSLESIFQIAKDQVIELKMIDLTDKEKQPKLTKQQFQTSITQLPTIPNTYTLQTEPNEHEISRSNTNKFKKLVSQDPKFSLMYSRFIKNVHSPHLVLDTLVQKKSFSRPNKQRHLNYHPKNDYQIPYQGLSEVLPEQSFINKQEISVISDYQSKESNFLPILQGNRNNRIKTLNANEQTLNSSLDKSKLSTTINTSSYANLPRTVSTHEGHNNSRYSRISSTKKVKPLNKSQSSKSVFKKKLDLPKFLVPFKDLVLNTWKGKIGPTAEENVLFSNCLGMLSLHREMTESIPDIKEYHFNENSQYTAVPSKSTRSQKNADKKFKKVIKSNTDMKQQLINLNIQQLDQIVEIEDPVDYLVSDNY